MQQLASHRIDRSCNRHCGVANRLLVDLDRPSAVNITSAPISFLTVNIHCDAVDVYGVLAKSIGVRTRMKPFKYLTDIVAADVIGLRDQIHCPATQNDARTEASIAISDLFQLAFSAKDQATRGRSWIKLSQMQRGQALAQATREFLISTLKLDVESATPVVIESWLDALRMIVSKSQKNENVTPQIRNNLYDKQAGLDREAIELNSTSYIPFLDHANPYRRCAAIFRMISVGVIDDAKLCRLMQILEKDDDANVQITAASALIECCTDNLRSEVLRILARQVANESIPLSVRDIAYGGIFQLAGEPVSTWPITRSCQGCFQFPNDIDWLVVKKYSDLPL